MIFMSDYILTYGGKRVTPLEPREEQIDIADIAHALSMIPRANGHLKYFYTVAQHCLNCASEAEARGFSARVRLACLLHDASEAYLSDVVRPIKNAMTDYLRIEKGLQECIYKKYAGSLTDEERVKIAEVDDAVLYHEFLNINGVALEDGAAEIFGALDFELRPREFIEKSFKEKFSELHKAAESE